MTSTKNKVVQKQQKEEQKELKTASIIDKTNKEHEIKPNIFKETEKENTQKSNISKKNNEKIKIPKEVLNNIFYCVLMAIIIITYFFTMNISYNGLVFEKMEKTLQLFSGIFLLIGLIFLEKAYRQDSGKKAVTAIEFLTLSMFNLSIIHFTKKYKFDFQIYLTAASYVLGIYYILKAIIIYTKGRSKELENLSDVKDIVKKDNPVVKEATKKLKNNENIKNSKNTLEIEEKNVSKKSQKNSATKNKKNPATKQKANTTKQTNNKTKTKTTKIQENKSTEVTKKEGKTKKSSNKVKLDTTKGK